MLRYAYQPSLTDNRQAQQNSQLAAVDDTSHIGSKSQENKPQEIMAHQTFLRRELRRKESRRSSQEIERQEIKPTIIQPVANPMYSSIQSTPDPVPPPDPFFKHQDASAMLSSMKPVNPKKNQEKPPQEVRSNQETIHQPAELQKHRKDSSIQSNYGLVPPPDQSFKHQDASAKLSTATSANPKKIQENSHQEMRSDQETAYHAVELQKHRKDPSIQSNSGPVLPPDQSFKRQDNIAKLSTAQSANAKKIQENPPQEMRSNQETTYQAAELQKHRKDSSIQFNSGPVPQSFKHKDTMLSTAQSVNLKKFRENPPQEIGSNQETTHQAAELQKHRKDSSIQSNSGPVLPMDQSFKLQDTTAKSSTAKSVNPSPNPNIKNTQENPPQETRSNPQTARQGVELRKAEPQKVEPPKVDQEESRHSPFHNLDHNTSVRANSSPAQLTAEPQEIKADRHARDQSEYTAQGAHVNVPGQHSTKANLFEKINHRESTLVEIEPQEEEIDPQEVKPQDVVPIKFLSGQGALASEVSLSQLPFKLPEHKTDNEKMNHGKSIKLKKPGPLAFLKGALAKQVKTEELSQDDVIIAVMGPTGSGKSTFIKLATGFETGVGHSLESCTSEINIVKLSVPELADGDVVFVDTPGFDDTHKSDADILKMVADWLKSTYEKEILLSGLLYFHRISDNRMAGTPLKNLRMFEELCGRNAFHNVILTTTMWDEVDEKTGVLREQELKTQYWRSMLDRNSTTSRFMHTRESALRLIEPLIDAANAKSSLLLQQEMVDMRTKLPATSAGLKLFSEMEALVKKRQEVLEQIRNAMKHSNEDKATLPALQEEYQRLRMQVDTTVKEMRKLRLPLGKRLSRMTRKWFSFKSMSFYWS